MRGNLTRDICWKGNLTKDILPEAYRDLIYVRNVPFHWPLEVALRLRRFEVCWERVNLQAYIKLWHIWKGEQHFQTKNNTIHVGHF